MTVSRGAISSAEHCLSTGRRNATAAAAAATERHCRQHDTAEMFAFLTRIRATARYTTYRANRTV